MKLYPSLIATALFAGSVTPAVADTKIEDVATLYGEINMSAQYADEGEGSFSELKSNASYIGVKGDYQLNDKLEVFYKVEFQVDLADLSGSDNLKSRDQYIGLRGGFGDFMLGRKDTVTKDLSKRADMFNDYEADFKGLWKGENRNSDSAIYYSPTYNNFGFAASYTFEDSVEGEDALSTAVYWGDNKLKKTDFYAAVMADRDQKGYDTERVMGLAKLGKLKLGAIYHQQEPSIGGETDKGYTVSAEYALDEWRFKGQYQTLEDDFSATVGADYYIGKKTFLFAWYTERDLEDEEDRSWLAVGIQHKF